MFALLASGAAKAANDDEFDPMTVNVVDAINCKIDVPTYNAFVMSLDSSEDKGAARRGWKKLKGANAFMDEWQLPKSVLVTGNTSTSRIGLTSTGLVAILDVADPKPLAAAEKIENQADPEALLKALVDEGSMTAEQARQIPRGIKFMGERTLVDASDYDEKLNMTFHSTIKRIISNKPSHPGKTLYGCAYKIDFTEGKVGTKAR